MITTILPACRAHAAVVDDLRAKLPPQHLDLAAIGALLALDERTRLDDSEVLAALNYLERRGEVQRTAHKGWRLHNGCQPAVTCLGPRGSGQVEAHDAQVVITGAAVFHRSPGLFPTEMQ